MKYTVYIREERNVKACVEADTENEAVAKAYISKELGAVEQISYSSHVIAEVSSKNNIKKIEEYDF